MRASARHAGIAWELGQAHFRSVGWEFGSRSTSLECFYVCVCVCVCCCWWLIHPPCCARAGFSIVV